MATIRPWARGPFELLVHAEVHYIQGDEFDRRIALIGFDNAIEVSIRTYLSLHPMQRDGKTFERQDLEKWTRNFHTLLAFFYEQVENGKLVCECDQPDVIHYHTIRNEQYHGGTLSLPPIDDLNGVRKAAHWVFGVLYGMPECERAVHVRAEELIPKQLHKRNDLTDHLIDQAFGEVEVANGLIFKTSEVLYGTDPEAYMDIGTALREDPELVMAAMSAEEEEWTRT